MRESLKPCPFCGEKIINIPYTRAYNGGLRQGVIRCNCGVEMRIKVVAPPQNESSRALLALLNPNAVVFDGDLKDVDAIIDFTRRAMSERWNTRAPERLSAEYVASRIAEMRELSEEASNEKERQ
nr:MAG TPA: restriction alleviation protein [Caudoviricetes sp.]